MTLMEAVGLLPGEKVKQKGWPDEIAATVARYDSGHIILEREPEKRALHSFHVSSHDNWEKVL